MCGIAAIFNIKEQTSSLRDKALKMAKRYAIADQTGAGYIVEVRLS